MSKLLLLYATLLVGLIFLIIPDWYTPIELFPFSDMKLSGANYIYLFGERSTLIILSYIIANESTEYHDALWVFFWLMVADLVDFCLTYNGVWFTIGNFPVSMNILKAVVFGVVIIFYGWIYIKQLWNRLLK